MTLPTALGFAGVAKETVKGTGVAPTAFPPIALARVWQDVLMQLDDTASRGSMVAGPFDQIPGGQYGTYDIPDHPYFPDTSPWWLMGILGDVVNLATRSVADAVTNSST